MTIIEVQPEEWIEGPALVPYRFGLFSTVPAQPFGNDHERAGVLWRSAGCGAVGVTEDACTVESPVDPLDPNVSCIISYATRFTVYARSDESMGGSPIDAKFQAARTALLAGEQYAVEAHLWAALVAATTGGETYAATNMVEAIALLEQGIADNYGGAPTIHTNRANATLAHDVIQRDGNSLATLLGSPVVAGGGYGGGGVEPVAIATGAVVIRRGEVQDLGRQYATTTNSIDAVVFRDYVVGWDCAAVTATIAEEA